MVLLGNMVGYIMRRELGELYVTPLISSFSFLFSGHEVNSYAQPNTTFMENNSNKNIEVHKY